MGQKRIRLTHRSREAVENSPPFPGDVGNEGRPYKKRDQYDNWEEVVNHPLPDMRTEWKTNPRNEEGFGIPKSGPPTVAAVKLAASKRVRLAVLLLGNKTPEPVIEDQARDFFALTEDVVDRTLARFSDTKELYSSADEETSEETKEASEEEMFEADVQARLAELVAESEAKSDDRQAKIEEKAQELLAKKAEEETEEETETETEEESKEASEEKSEVEEESKEAAEETQEESKEAVAEEKEPEKQAMGEMDIEMTTAMLDEPVADPVEDAKLAELFDSPQATEKSEDSTQKEASEKQGVKKLGGQPKVASSDAPADLSQLWDSAPDVSEAFK